MLFVTEKEYPSIPNLGKNCMFWKRDITYVQDEQQKTGCIYPKAELIGRTSCEGIIDDVCLFILCGRKPKSLTQEQIDKLILSRPSLTHEFEIPPGGIEI